MRYPGIFFLFYFLPALLALYHALGFVRVARDAVLLLASLAFLSWGDPAVFLILVCGIAVNWLFGLLLHSPEETPGVGATALVCVAVVFNAGLLFLFKYAAVVFGGDTLPVTFRHPLPQPVVSLFVLQALSYVFDVHARAARAERNPVYLGLYLAFFAPLIAGPVQRYADIAGQLRARRPNFSGVAEGCARLVLGLGKVALVVPPLGAASDRVFLLSSFDNYTATVPALLAWTGAAMFVLSLYLGLSGYADMAIGLGRMFGFAYRENFNHPFAALSVSDFWQRWNISLVGWFSRYLGVDITGRSSADAGIRRGATVRNLCLAWVVVGLWHGANWTFVAWGLWNAVFLFGEKILRVPGYRLPSLLGRLYALLVVCCGWILYRAESVTDALTYFANMIAVNYNGFHSDLALALLRENRLVLGVALVLCLPVSRAWERKFPEGLPGVWRAAFGLAQAAFLLAVYGLSVVYLVGGESNLM